MGNTDSGRTPQRLSTYSNTPTLTPSVAPTHISASAAAPKKPMAAVRASYISTAPSVASTDSSASRDPLSQDLRILRLGLDRLEDKRLSSQRYVVTHSREEQMSALALGAKLERALGRRMTSQDAVFTNKVRTAVTVSEVKA
jgi:hypothetical protein